MTITPEQHIAALMMPFTPGPGDDRVREGMEYLAKLQDEGRDHSLPLTSLERKK